jgi:nicotinamide mononucleotide transporter
MNYLLIIELVSVLFNLLFLYLYILEKKSCWTYGILGSLTGAFIVYSSNLYSETLLYLFYALMGGFALVIWHTKSTETFLIKSMKLKSVLGVVVTGILLALGLGFAMSNTDADKPYVDALSTVFGVIATFLEIYKYHIAWSFWIAINIYSIGLYLSSDLFFYAAQSILYTIMSIYGLVAWQKKLNAQ